MKRWPYGRSLVVGVADAVKARVQQRAASLRGRPEPVVARLQVGHHRSPRHLRIVETTFQVAEHAIGLGERLADLSERVFHIVDAEKIDVAGQDDG